MLGRDFFPVPNSALCGEEASAVLGGGESTFRQKHDILVVHVPQTNLFFPSTANDLANTPAM
jgi:hypothetical protein